MRVLLVGKGGREHALAAKLASSPLLGQLFVWPGSPVLAPYGESLDLPPTAPFPELVAMSSRLGIELVVSGPETPLSEGLADAFLAARIPTFGPLQAAAQLESSKAFAKEMMAKAGVPTASYRLVRDERACREAAMDLLETRGGAVLKASGLAAGKGVFVCNDVAAIEEGLRHLYQTDMCSAAETVVVESILVGRECSYFSFIGAGGPTGLGFAVDFKRLEDQDRGPNTGGMGCYAPVPWLPHDAEEQVVQRVVKPLLAALKMEGIPYLGCLYVGVMWSETEGPQVVEFNVRLGDPEAQVLAAYDDRDWLAVIAAKCGLKVPKAALDAATQPITHGESAVAVVMTSHSYPFGDEPAEAAVLPLSMFQHNGGPVRVFGASLTAGDAQTVKTGSGRVLTVTARAATFAYARALAYGKVREIGSRWPGAHWRRDIAQRMAKESN